MSISTFARAASGSLLRSLWSRDRVVAGRRRARRTSFRPAIDCLESRVALAITTPLSIGGTTVGTFTDTPTGPGNIGDYVTVSIEGTRGTVVFNGGAGVADGTDIQTIDIFDASPDFQITFNGLIQTANPVPYGSDGIIQLGTITTANVIRGVNTVRGPATNVAVAYTPNGFTQVPQSEGSGTVTLTGDVTGTFAGGSPGTFVVATPLLPTVGTPVFTTVSTSSYSSGTNTTTVVLNEALAGNTTAGALTTAATRNVEFQLTQFSGVNFSNRNLKEAGGLFVDTVLGDSASNIGIILSQGLLGYSSIGIRNSLDAIALIGTSGKASADGRMFVESATQDSAIYIGPQTKPTSQNSKFQLLGGAGTFGAGVFANQPFDGVVNLGGAATGSWLFARGVGANASLNARSWVGQTSAAPFGVNVVGNFAGSINATNGEGPNDGEIALSVFGNLAATARVNNEDDLALAVQGSVIKGAAIASGNDISINVGGNFAGSMTAGGDLSGGVGGSLNGAVISATSDLTLEVGGSIVNSRLAAYSEMSVDVAGNVINSGFTTSYDYELSLNVGGNMSGSTVQGGSSDVSVSVAGNVTNSQFGSTYSDVTLDVGGEFLKSRIVTGDKVSLTVGRDALDNTVIGDDVISLSIGRNWRGVAQSASSDVKLLVGGSVLAGSSFLSGEDTLVNVQRNFDGSTTSRNLRFFVGGNVSQASRIVAQQVTDWQSAGNANFGIGGRFDGIVNVGLFDAAPNFDNVTLIGGGAGTSARFYVDRFAPDSLEFSGNFRGNLRVNQDLVANLAFNGNVERITIGGRVGSYDGVTPVLANINVTGRLLYLNTNSYFQATTPGQSGVFWNTAFGTNGLPGFVSTGTLATGRYVTVVPNLQQVNLPPVPGPMVYTTPSAPTTSAASQVGSNISLTFAAPTGPGADGNLPILSYQYTTDNGANWRNFDTVSQGPGTAILTVDSQGNAFTDVTYTVGVRAINALGNSSISNTQSVPYGTG
jgi:hypothetical protein